jgi:hypothetical protein
MAAGAAGAATLLASGSGAPAAAAAAATAAPSAYGFSLPQVCWLVACRAGGEECRKAHCTLNTTNEQYAPPYSTPQYGKAVALADRYAGKVVVVVNIASA